MKLTIHDISYMLADIAKPYKANYKIFFSSYWVWEGGYCLSLYIVPMDKTKENRTTYFSKIYCNYTLTELNVGPIKEYHEAISSIEDFASFIEEVLSLKKHYIG